MTLHSLHTVLLVTILYVVSFIHESSSNSTLYYLFDTANSEGGTWNPHRINKKDTQSGTTWYREFNDVKTVPGNDYTAGYYDDSSTSVGSNQSPHQYKNQENGIAAFHQLYPASTFAHHYYGQNPGGYNNGWNYRTTGIGHKGTQIDFSNFNWNEFMDNMVYSPMAQMIGLKGGDGSLVKFGIVFPLIIVPLIILVTVPLSTLIVILILSIPFPIVSKNHPVYKSLQDSTEIFAKSLLSTDECIEKMSCHVYRLAQMYGKETWINRITNELSNVLDLKSSSKNNSPSWKNKISRGFSSFSRSTESTLMSSCLRFSCNPMKSLKKVLTI